MLGENCGKSGVGELSSKICPLQQGEFQLSPGFEGFLRAVKLFIFKCFIIEHYCTNETY